MNEGHLSREHGSNIPDSFLHACEKWNLQGSGSLFRNMGQVDSKEVCAARLFSHLGKEVVFNLFRDCKLQGIWNLPLYNGPVLHDSLGNHIRAPDAAPPHVT